MIIETPMPGLLYRGKVRDTFDLGDGLLLMVATDRISAFDVVLPTGIPDKGLVLNKISAFGSTARLTWYPTIWSAWLIPPRRPPTCGGAAWPPS